MRVNLSYIFIPYAICCLIPVLAVREEAVKGNWKENPEEKSAWKGAVTFNRGPEAAEVTP